MAKYRNLETAEYRKTKKELCLCVEVIKKIFKNHDLMTIGINLLVVYRESVNLIGYITGRLSADSLQL